MMASKAENSAIASDLICSLDALARLAKSSLANSGAAGAAIGDFFMDFRGTLGVLFRARTSRSIPEWFREKREGARPSLRFDASQREPLPYLT